jgi:tetratricopeptide (TPR) repeat protein
VCICLVTLIKSGGYIFQQEDFIFRSEHWSQGFSPLNHKMKHNLKNLIRIIAAILFGAVIYGCTTTDKKCMPFTSSSPKAKKIALEALALNVDGFNTKSVELFKQALDLDSNFVVANLMYGQNAGLTADKRHEYFMKAEREINKVSEAEQHLIKSYLALEKNDRENVINELKEIIKLYPEDKYMLRLLAVRYSSVGQQENALEYARKSYQADTNFSTIVNYQGYILNAMKKYDDAEKWYKKSIAMKQSVPSYYNNYGVLLRTTGRIDEAIEMHKKALELEKSSGTYMVLGHCYTAKGDYEKAREYYSKATDLATTNAQKNSLLLFNAYTWLYEGKVAEGCSALDKCIEFEKKSGEMNTQAIDNTFNKAMSCLYYMDRINAEKYINESAELISSLKLSETELNNYKKYHLFFKGWLQAQSGNIADAQKTLDEFKKSMKDDAELKSMQAYWDSFQGIIAFNKKNWTDAIKFLSSVNVDVATYIVGEACLNAGDKEKAKEIFTKITSNNLIGFQQAIVKPLAKSKLNELSK